MIMIGYKFKTLKFYFAENVLKIILIKMAVMIFFKFSKQFVNLSL